MKTIFYLLLLTSISSFAEDFSFPMEKIRNEEPMVYLRNGKTVGNFLSENEIIMNSVGFLQYSEDFVYGVEYSSYFGKNNSYRVKNFQFISGYRHLWNKRFLPYGLLQFGTSSFKNDNNDSLDRGDGISTTVDLGFDVLKIWKIKTSVGFRKTEAIFSNEKRNSFSFSDFYLMVGFVF